MSHGPCYDPQAELELDRVQAEEKLVGEAMELELDKFEKEKLEDVKVHATASCLLRPP